MDGKRLSVSSGHGKVRISILLLSVLGIVTFIGGYYWLSQITQRQGEPFEKVSIGVTDEPLKAIVIIAQEKNFFLREGVDVTLKHYRSGKLALDGMFNGEVDLADIAETPIVFRSFERRDFRIIAAVGSSDNDQRLIVRQDHGIQEPKDLRGKRIATAAPSPRFFLHLFLLKHGMSEKDITLSIKKPDELVLAFVKGEIDAFSFREPFLTQAKDALKDKAVIFTERGLYLKTVYLVALNSFIKDRAQAIKKILRALIKAEKFMKNQPAEVIKIVSNKLKVPESEISALWNEFDFTISLKQDVFNILEDEARWAIKSGFTDKKEVPNYLNFIYLDGLKAVKPEAVTIIR